MAERFTIETRDDDGEEYDVLVDQSTGLVVFEDGGEPEDMTLGRNLAPLVTLINQLAREAIF